MFYREYQPDPGLRPMIRNFWVLRCQDPVPAQRIVPDGNPEIVVNAGDEVRRTDVARRVQERVLVVGQIRRAMVIEPAGETDLFGIRFTPTGLRQLTGVAMQGLTDADACVSVINRRFRDELEGIRRGASAERRIVLATAALRRQQERAAAGVSERTWIAADADRRLRQNPSMGIDDLATRMKMSRRTIERAFAQEIGVTPKWSARVHRLAGVLRCLEAGGLGYGWASLAAGHGYVDQAHLIREFRRLVGVTPTAYVRERPELSGLFLSSGVSQFSNPS